MKYGKKYRFYGKISNKYGKIDITSPVFDEIEKKNNTGKIIPLYPLTFKLTQNTIRKIIENGLVEIKEKARIGLRVYSINDVSNCRHPNMF